MIQAGIDHTYAGFGPDWLRAGADVEAWMRWPRPGRSGRAAYDRGLVDTLGGLEDAIGEAARLAGLEATACSACANALDAMLCVGGGRPRRAAPQRRPGPGGHLLRGSTGGA